MGRWNATLTRWAEAALPTASVVAALMVVGLWVLIVVKLVRGDL